LKPTVLRLAILWPTTAIELPKAPSAELALYIDPIIDIKDFLD
jgi:hypothetical protein